MRHFFTGIAIYASGALVGQALIALGLYDGWGITVATLVTLFLFAFLAGMDLQARFVREIMPYSLSWVLIAVALDSLLVAPALGWSFLIAIDTLVGYAIIALAPLFVLLVRGGDR